MADDVREDELQTDETFEEDFEDVDGAEDLEFDVDAAVAQAESVDGDLADRMKSLVEWVVVQLVDDPESVGISADQRGGSVRVQVRLPEESIGKIIGRGGRIAKSMRTVLQIVGAREHVRVSLDIEGRD